MEYGIDTTRIFVTGISNGGIFSLFLAYKLSHKILAIAPVTANIPENISGEYNPGYPVSMMLINGTSDPLIKYEGGDVGFKKGGNRGRTISTDETIKTFISQFKCESVPEIDTIPDLDKTDDCTSVKYTYNGCTGKTAVVLIKIINGGHTWPGGSHYLPVAIIGNVCNDFSASEYIWNFFKTGTIR
jgi:polyhydroxybutyrate depolymerase